jgi:hypothetical protein
MDIAYKLLQGDDEDEIKIMDWIQIAGNRFFMDDFKYMQRIVLQCLEYKLFPYTLDLIPQYFSSQTIVSYVCMMFDKKEDKLNPLVKEYLIDQMNIIQRDPNPPCLDPPIQTKSTDNNPQN